MRSLVDLAESLLQDLGEQCGAEGVRKDLESMRSRVEHEGDSFITITLPAFADALERALEEGSVALRPWKGFALQRSGVPRFLSGFLRRVFDSDGLLMASPSTDCIFAIRQFCRFAKRVLLPCKREVEIAAVEEYVQCDTEVVEPDGKPFGEDPLWDTFRAVGSVLVRRLQLDSATTPYVPTHGPGAVVERLTPNQRWGRLPYWPARLNACGLTYRMAMFGHEDPLWGEPSGQDGSWDPPLRRPWEETPVKVVLVPKTLTKPRVIAVEPAAQQFMQQGVSRWFRDRLEEDDITGNVIRFRDQGENQFMALLGSVSGHLATLDMSEASDRVGLGHVRTLFAESPDFLRTLEACRSQRARLPFDGREVNLRKYASMGSALCFPIEAFVFATAIIASRLRSNDLPPTERCIEKVSRPLAVYGDDLIVPSDEAPVIVEDLEALGFKVNRRKSFWSGKFRESCGVDAYGGVNITPIYLRRMPPSDHADIVGLLSTVATANFLHQKGLYRTRDLLKQQVERAFGLLPNIDACGESPAIGWTWESTAQARRRWNRHLQREEELHWVATPPRAEDPLTGNEALAKCFRLPEPTDLADLPVNAVSRLEQQFHWRILTPQDWDHLTLSVRPYVLKLKRRWLPTVATGAGL